MFFSINTSILIRLFVIILTIFVDIERIWSKMKLLNCILQKKEILLLFIGFFKATIKRIKRKNAVGQADGVKKI